MAKDRAQTEATDDPNLVRLIVDGDVCIAGVPYKADAEGTVMVPAEHVGVMLNSHNAALYIGPQADDKAEK